jgi:endonuclease YncB( thermonuclease family)
MILKTLIVAATLATAVTSQAYAQDVQAGFDPSSILPTVSLPQRTSTALATPVNQKPSPEVSTAVTRNGTIRSTTDLQRAPDGALEAAAATSSGLRPQSTTSDNSENKYRAGMILYGKAQAFDGHTLLVDGHAIRLNGIEAPGIKQLCSTVALTSWRCGQKAFERLSALVNSGKVRCTVVSSAGHGAAATCSASQTKDIGALLVMEGLALPNRHSSGIYNGQVTTARNARRGLWIGPFTDPAKWRLENRY